MAPQTVITPTPNPLQQLVNLLLWLGERHSPATLRRLQALLGDRFPLFGGRAYCQFYDVTSLLGEAYEKLDWLYGPLDDRADYLTRSYLPFLQPGPNHRARREAIAARAAEALRRVDQLEPLLQAEPNAERALARFLFRHLGRFEATDADVAALFEYRRWGSLLTLLPKWLRTTLFH